MQNLFNEILSMSFDSAWLIGAVIMVRALLYKAPKYFYKILWGLVGLRLLIPFSFKSALSLIPQETSEAVTSVAAQVVNGTSENKVTFIGVAAVVWLLVCLAFSVYGIVSYFRLKVKICDGVIYKDNIYYSEKIESPFVCGFIKPRIYIPYGLDEETQKCVLQHEKMHIKHCDHILKYLGFAVLCIHWFNPLVWVSYFLFCKDIELACDECVVRNYDTDGCKKYAGALLELGVNKVKLSACPVAFGEVSIKHRIKSVINYKKAGRVLVFASLFLCVAVAVCFMTEPHVPLKAKVEKTEVSEKKTESVTERVTEAVTEEPVTEPVQETEPATESTTDIFNGYVAQVEAAEETTEFTLIIPKVLSEEDYARMNPFYTEYHKSEDSQAEYTDKNESMRDQAEEAGLFVDRIEKEKIVQVLENE